MFKKLALLLISLIALPVSIASTSYSFNHTSMVVADDEDPEPDLGPSPYEFTEDTETGYYYIARYYELCNLIPTVNKNFCAPNGYTFTLSYSDEQVDALLDEMDRCKADYYGRMYDCVFYYTIMDTTVYSDSDPEIIYSREEARSFILAAVNGFKLFEVRELNQTLNLSFTFEFQFCIKDPDFPDKNEYHFMLTDDTIMVEPYDENDFISLHAAYIIRDGEPRFNVGASLINGFFFEEPSNNESGFHTDTTNTVFGQTKAAYQIDIYANDTIVIGTMYSVEFHGVEMYYNDTDLALKAKLSFESAGVHYEYWSRTLMVGNPKFHTIIDGYFDRDFIQRDQEHTFTLNLNRNVFNPEIGYFGGSVSVSAFPIGLSDPDYGHIYRSREELPEIGQANNYYYILTEEEAATYNSNDSSFTTGWGDLYYWDQETQQYDYYWGETVIDSYINDPYVYNPESPYYDPNLDINDMFTNITSLPFVGEWEFRYNVFFGGNNYYLQAQTGYGQTVQVVSTGDTDNKVSLNVPDNINLVVGGDALEIVPSLLSKDNSLVYYYECELSKDGVVSATKADTGDKFVITPLGAGTVELTITVESRLFDKISKTVTINVIDNEAVYSVAKIDAPSGYVPAGEDLVCALNIKGMKSFQNIDIDWDVTKSSGEAVPAEKIVDNKNASITILNADIGDYTIAASYEGVELDKITRHVRYQANNASSAEDSEIVLNVPDSINLLSGGDSIDIIASVSPFSEGTDYYFDYSFSKENVVTYSVGENGKITLQPINSGTVTLNITVNYEPNHVLTKTINIRVLDAIYDVSSIKVPDEFHYAGKDLTASINIRGFQGFQNLDIDWVVTNKKGEELAEDKIINNGDASITIVEPGSDDYTISASYEGILLDSIVVKVRHIDMNKFLRINIWWIFLLTVGMVLLILFLRSLMHKSKTTVQNIEKVYEIFCACMSDDKLSKDELIRIKKELSKCLHRCEDLNIEALNQYEKAIRYLRKSLFDVKTLLNNWETISPEDKGAYTDHLDKDLNKALSVAKEIENAKQLIEEYHFKANKHNYESINDENDSKRKKNK